MLQNFESDLTMRKRGRPEVEALSKDKTVISSDTRAHDHDLKVLDIINASNKGINFIQLKESIIADPYPGYPANKMTPNEINLAILRLSEQGKIEKKELVMVSYRLSLYGIWILFQLQSQVRIILMMASATKWLRVQAS